jgi:hypothetical protein
MKNFYLLFAFMTITILAAGQTTDLLISEYIEGSGNNKALEIYNGTGADVDLSNYQVWKISNGGNWPENTLSLSGTLSDGDVYVIYNSSSDPVIVAEGDLTWTQANWNGDDAVGIAKDDGTGTFVLIDAVGEEGSDPGSGWTVAGIANATKNHTLVRKPAICSPTTDWNTSRGTNSNDAQWIVYDQNNFSFIGAHQANCGTGSGPDNPVGFDASTASTSEIELTWNPNNAADDVMLAWSATGSFGTPVDGTTYSAGSTISGGGTVLYNGSNTDFNHTGLTSGTKYFYKAWSVDLTTKYSSGVTEDATTFKAEPVNHVSGFLVDNVTATSAKLVWNDNDGAVAADSFLVIINTTGIFTAPVDGTPQANDPDVSDGAGLVNVAHGTETYTWVNLVQGTHYYFTIYPFTNGGLAVDYKTDDTVPVADATTTIASGATDLFISEYIEGSGNNKALELYNGTGADVDLSNYQIWKISNGGNWPENSLSLNGILHNGDVYIIYNANADAAIVAVGDVTWGSATWNGDDAVGLAKTDGSGNFNLIDAVGEDGADPGSGWDVAGIAHATANHTLVRKSTVFSPTTNWALSAGTDVTSSQWIVYNSNDFSHLGSHTASVPVIPVSGWAIVFAVLLITLFIGVRYKVI